MVKNWPASNPVGSGPKVKSFFSRKVNLAGLRIRKTSVRTDPDLSYHFIADTEPTFQFNADTDPDSGPHQSDEDQLHFADPDLAFTVMRTRFQHPKINPDPFGSGSASLVFYM